MPVAARCRSGACSTSYRSHATPSAPRRGAIAARRGRALAVRPEALLKPAEGVAATWSQTADEVLVRVPVKEGVRGRNIGFEVHPKRLVLSLDGKPLLAGDFDGTNSVNADESFWTMESDDSGKYVLITLAKKAMGYMSWEMLLQSDRVDDAITDRAWMQIKVGDEVMGKLVIGLFGNVVPKTVENFKTLVTGEKSDEDGKPMHYKGVPFHRIIPGFMAQGGDITSGDGFGGKSIWGNKFEDENFKLRHAERGYVAMANAGPNTNGSQFYICFGEQPHLDGKHVVFGRVEAGIELLGRMEEHGSQEGKPDAAIVVADCGLASAADVEAIVDENKQLSLAS